MNTKTLRSLMWFAIISILSAMAVMSPVAGFALYLSSAIFSVFPAFWGTNGVRLAGIVILALSLLLSVATYPKFNTEMAAYRAHTRNNAAETKPAAGSIKSKKVTVSLP